jgi:hypothetical protein
MQLKLCLASSINWRIDVDEFLGPQENKCKKIFKISKVQL